MSNLNNMRIIMVENLRFLW